VHEDDPAVPTSPYGSSKLMTEMLRDAGAAHGLRYMMLRYFNVAGADPLGRTGQSTKGATHLIKVSVETALGLWPKVDVFVTDYPTPDGTCTVPVLCSNGGRISTTYKPWCATHWHGSKLLTRAA
jgi:UDP-glucose 4-epimerase